MPVAIVPTAQPRIVSVTPSRALPGARLAIEGGPFPCDGVALPRVRVGGLDARVVFASPSRLVCVVPEGLDGRTPVRVEAAPGETAFVELGVALAHGFHQVDNPAVDATGHAFVTCSAARGQETAVSVYRITPGGVREIFAEGIVNATSLAFDPEGRLHVSSRFDGTVSRLDANGRAEVVYSDLGIACGLAFAPDGTLFVGDRSGTVFRALPDGHVEPWAILPPSIAAFHLARSPQGELAVSAPTLSPTDALYRIGPGGEVSTFDVAFGRPQGVAYDLSGHLHVVEALAGVSGVYRVEPGTSPELVVAGPGLVGLTFGPDGTLYVASNDTLWRFGPTA